MVGCGEKIRWESRLSALQGSELGPRPERVQGAAALCGKPMEDKWRLGEIIPSKVSVIVAVPGQESVVLCELAPLQHYDLYLFFDMHREKLKSKEVGQSRPCERLQTLHLAHCFARQQT